MQGELIGEDDLDIGTIVTDNNGVEHQIEMHKKNGEIYAHTQDGYPDDPAERTSAENEHVNQARRFATYSVFTERGYDTVEHAENPTYINAVRKALASLSQVDFTRYLGAVHRQLRSHHEDSERPVELPATVRAPDAVVYELDVYLGIDLTDGDIAEQVQRLTQTEKFDTDSGIQPVSDLSDGELDRWKALGDNLVDIADTDDLDVDLTIAAVSGIHVGYPDARGQHQVQEADDPLDREADARLELLPYAPADIEEFRDFLDHHLRCQIRDCFLKMGVVPPAEFQVVGFGKFHDARRYDHFEMYPEVHKRGGDHTPLFG